MRPLVLALFAAALCSLAAPHHARAEWWDITGDSVCSPEATTGLQVFLQEEGPREPEAGPASEDHARSLQIFRGRFHGLVPSQEMNDYLTATLRNIL